MHSNTLNYTVLHTFEHSNTLWITIGLLNSGKYARLVIAFFSSIYTFLEEQFLQLNSYFSHFEFQIFNRPCLISNNNLWDDNTCHISFWIVNKHLLSNFLKIELFYFLLFIPSSNNSFFNWTVTFFILNFKSSRDLVQYRITISLEMITPVTWVSRL